MQEQFPGQEKKAEEPGKPTPKEAPEAKREMSRAEIEAFVELICGENKKKIESQPKELSTEQSWTRLEQFGEAVDIVLDEKLATEMYILDFDKAAGEIEITYFENGQVCETFWVNLSRITKISTPK